MSLPVLKHKHVGERVPVLREREIRENLMRKLLDREDSAVLPQGSAKISTLASPILCTAILFTLFSTYSFSLLLLLPFPLQFLQLPSTGPTALRTRFILSGSSACSLLAHQLMRLRGLSLLIISQLRRPLSDNSGSINILRFSWAHKLV